MLSVETKAKQLKNNLYLTSNKVRSDRRQTSDSRFVFLFEVRRKCHLKRIFCHLEQNKKASLPSFLPISNLLRFRQVKVSPNCLLTDFFNNMMNTV